MTLLKLLTSIFITLSLLACSQHEKTTPNQETLTLESKPLTTSLYFPGIVQPLKTIVITSPADGVIQDMFFHFGDNVKPNQLLFTISSEKFQTDYKNSLMQYIKTKNEFNTSHSQLMQSEFLHKNELISDDEFKTKQSAYYNAQLALVQAKENLHSMLKQLTVQGFNLDALTIENIDKITQALHAQGDSQQLRITAPAAGVVLLPGKSDGSEGEAKKISKGDLVKQGDVLAVVGDTHGVTIRVNVNEFNINQLKAGQKVKVTGAAFSEFELQGRIEGLDKQGQTNSGGMPIFPVEIVVPTLTAQEQAVIHMGMSAKVEINLSSDAKISVPITAILEKNGATFVRKQDAKSKKIKEVAVKTGLTTADSIVIESGLVPGDQIVFTR